MAIQSKRKKNELDAKWRICRNEGIQMIRLLTRPIDIQLFKQPYEKQK